MGKANRVLHRRNRWEGGDRSSGVMVGWIEGIEVHRISDFQSQASKTLGHGYETGSRGKTDGSKDASAVLLGILVSAALCFLIVTLLVVVLTTTFFVVCVGGQRISAHLLGTKLLGVSILRMSGERVCISTRQGSQMRGCISHGV